MAAQLDLSEGIDAAVPGWADIRLLAPHAELRLLACGQGTLIDATRLRCCCRQPSCIDGCSLTPTLMLVLILTLTRSA